MVEARAFEFAQHLLEDLCGLRGYFASLFARRAMEDVDADLDEAYVFFDILGRGTATRRL